MFKFKKTSSELSEDMEKYINDLDLEDELKKMNILPPTIVSNQETIVSDQKISLDIETKDDININNIEVSNMNFQMLSEENKTDKEIYHDSVKNNGLLRAA